MSIQYCKDTYNLTKEGRATRMEDTTHASGLGVAPISRNSPIMVARRDSSHELMQGEELVEPEIVGQVTSNFSDPLSVTGVVAEAVVTARNEGPGQDEDGGGRTIRGRPHITVVGKITPPTPGANVSSAKDAVAVARSDRIKTAGGVVDQTTSIDNGSGMLYQPLDKSSTAVVPFTPAPTFSAVPTMTKIPVQIKSPSIGSMRCSVDFVSQSDVVLALGYLVNDASMSYEPPVTTGDSRLTVVIAGESYICASMGLSFESEYPGTDTKVLWVVLIKDLA